MGIRTLRTKFLVALVVIFLILGGIFAVTGITMIRSIVLKEAQGHVESDLRVAWSEYNHKLDDVTRILQLIGGKTILLSAMKNGDETAITSRLELLMKQYGLDFITVLDKEGRVFTRARYPHERGDPAYLDGVVAGAMKGKETKGTVIIPKEVLEKEGDGLVKRAFLELIPTPMAKLSPYTLIDSALALKAGIPIWEGNDQIGIIYGGLLLNRNHPLVDQIQEMVFQEKTYEGRQLGTVTIFQWDTRVATTVRNENGTRAIGTRVSSEVYDRVLENGQSWVGKAFVVRDWYLSAYEPIFDPEKNIVGIIYVGVLEKKFADYKRNLFFRFLLTAGIGILVAFVLSYILLSSLVRPINRLAQAARQVANGQFPSKIHEEEVYKEVYDLTHAFNTMIQFIRDRDERLQNMNADLTRVNDELNTQNKSYMELLGFVVHELKAPINSITLGLSAMMTQSIGTLNDKQRRAAQIIMKNASYLNTMIRNYLDLSRIEQGEFTISLKKVLLEEEVIEPIKFQLISQLEAAEMNIVDEVPKEVEADCDPDFMKVVMNNLLSNATKYGQSKSTIKILYQDLGADVQIGVWNEGKGLPPASIAKLFTKFTDVVSKDRTGKKGTGLGLFITKEIIEAHGGTIWAESEPEKWMKVTFRIPKRQKEKQEPAGKTA